MKTNLNSFDTRAYALIEIPIGILVVEREAETDTPVPALHSYIHIQSLRFHNSSVYYLHAL